MIYVDIGDLATWFVQQGKIGGYAPHSAVLLLDEGYAGMDSRSSMSSANKMLSTFVFQSRKCGLDLLVACQLASSLDKRIRNLTDAWILAEIQPRQTYDVEGNVTSSVDDFHYTYAGVDGSFNEFWLTHEQALQIFPHYNTMEIVQPPMITLDKKEAFRAKKVREKQGIDVRRRQRSEVRPMLE